MIFILFNFILAVLIIQTQSIFYDLFLSLQPNILKILSHQVLLMFYSILICQVDQCHEPCSSISNSQCFQQRHLGFKFPTPNYRCIKNLLGLISSFFLFYFFFHLPSYVLVVLLLCLFLHHLLIILVFLVIYLQVRRPLSYLFCLSPVPTHFLVMLEFTLLFQPFSILVDCSLIASSCW